MASKLSAQWGLGIVLGSLGGSEAWMLGAVAVVLGQLGGYLFREKKGR